MKDLHSLGRVACVAAVVLLAGGCACPQEQPPPAQPAAAPAAAPRPAPAPVREDVSLSAEALFDFNKDTLRPDAASQLQGLVDRYRGNASLVSMDVVGHADSVGSDDYNQRLSERRANAVRDFLVQQGVDGSKIRASGRGESDPAASNDTAEGRQKNRRVDLSALIRQ